MAATLPTPTTLYVYNDLPYFAPPPAEARWSPLIAELLRLLRAQSHVRFLEIATLIEALACSGASGPYARALAIGGSGRRVADLIQARTGWFSAVTTLALSREETDDGGHRIVAAEPERVESLLAATASERVAIVDDTIYSGLTLRWLLDRLPAGAQPEVLCLQALQTASGELAARCPVYAGVQLAGEREIDLSVIKASHLFEPGAIRTAGAALAFYERRAWLDAWFPAGTADAIATICAELRALLPAAAG